MKKSKLDTWVRQGLINETQAERIFAFEHQSRKDYGFLTALFIGLFIVIIGIISLIAANWQQLSPTVKIVAFFFVYAATSGTQLLIEEKRPVLADVCRVLFFGLTIAGIGLIAQVFHLKSNGYSALVFWVSITALNTMYSYTRVLPTLWWLSYYVGGIAWVINYPSLGEDIRGMFSNIVFLAPFLFLMKKETTGSSSMTKFIFPIKYFRPAILWLLLPINLNLMWNAGLEKNPFIYTGISLLVWGCILAVLEYRSTLDLPEFHRWRSAFSMIFPLFIAGLGLINPEFSLGKIGGGIFSLAVFYLAAFYYYYRREFGLFKIFSLAIVVRLIVIYFEVFGSLLNMGIGFIISGIVIIGITYTWHRIHKTLITAGK